MTRVLTSEEFKTLYIDPVIKDAVAQYKAGNVEPLDDIADVMGYGNAENLINILG